MFLGFNLSFTECTFISINIKLEMHKPSAWGDLVHCLKCTSLALGGVRNDVKCRKEHVIISLLRIGHTFYDRETSKLVITKCEEKETVTHFLISRRKQKDRKSNVKRTMTGLQRTDRLEGGIKHVPERGVTAEGRTF